MYIFITAGQDKFHATKVEITSLNGYQEEETTIGYKFDNGLVLIQLGKTEFIFISDVDFIPYLSDIYQPLKRILNVDKTNESFVFDHAYLLSLVVLNLEEINKDCLIKKKVTELLLGVD